MGLGDVPLGRDAVFKGEGYGLGSCPKRYLLLVTKSCPALYDPMDCSPSGSSVHGIFQERILEWVALSFIRDITDLGVESESPVSPALTDGLFTTEPPRKSHTLPNKCFLVSITLRLAQISFLLHS